MVPGPVSREHADLPLPQCEIQGLSPIDPPVVVLTGPQADAPVYRFNPTRQNQRETATKPTARASVPSRVAAVRRPVRLSAGTVTAKATGIRKVNETRSQPG